MAVFAIISDSLQPKLKERIDASYPDHFQWSDRVWTVNSTETAQAIAQKVGVEPRDANGQGKSDVGHVLVLALAASYWGYGATSFWDWLKSAFQRST